MSSTVAKKPEYVIAVTENVTGPMPDGVWVAVGKRQTPAGELVKSAQTRGSGECFSWVLDTDGTIYELAGWDRAPWTDRGYVIMLAVPGGEVSQAQYDSLDWLAGQLERKKGIDPAWRKGL